MWYNAIKGLYKKFIQMDLYHKQCLLNTLLIYARFSIKSQKYHERIVSSLILINVRFNNSPTL